MKITAGTQVIENARLYSEKAWEQGAARPTLRVVLAGGITDAQIDALKQNSWSVSGDVQIEIARKKRTCGAGTASCSGTRLYLRE